jgi:holo-[acyl-carrier protein] synthase
MNIQTGIDIVNIQRFKETCRRTPSILESFFSEKEVDNNIDTLAGMFAAKEAVKKADNSIKNWKEIIIIKDENGKPSAHIPGKKVSISISHEEEYAVAMAIVYNEHQ